MAKKVTEDIQAEFPELPIMWGGIHPTSVPEECILTATTCVWVRVRRRPSTLRGAARRRRRDQHPEHLGQGGRRGLPQQAEAPIQDLDWLPYPDTADENKFYIEKGKLTIEEP